ncbi:uncharacterized protein FA14DRAFT_141966 [Meira miltonrushii]|uniref:t-SNARE coiled-coil homology domain-containing protein n=1 Tax=Meira miltonrushii TaxID=1280837 RepID=A0A316VJ93_9BASI|nr:uncharacterized protein FA14DRAFT_141966 [Meira miltonrushii]PWN37570.1 hypothetical protein FA14DRAFT_141966 [Meira miltonrushii]
MSRRPGAGVNDRHTLLSSAAYPSSYRIGSGFRNVSTFEQPYGDTSDPYAEYDVHKGAPKKEPGALGASDVGRGFSNLFGLRTAEQLEEQNDEHLEGLSAKVRILKDITVGIGNEVRDSTKDLDSLGEAFSNSSAFLGNTFNRMKHMASRQGSWHCNMFLFVLFIIWIFVILWWWRR